MENIFIPGEDIILHFEDKNEDMYLLKIVVNETEIYASVFDENSMDLLATYEIVLEPLDLGLIDSGDNVDIESLTEMVYEEIRIYVLDKSTKLDKKSTKGV